MSKTAGHRVALIQQLFHGPRGPARLTRALSEAAAAGAVLAVLPELALDPWVPAGRTVREEEAEDPRGPRLQTLSMAAREAELAVLGGAIVRDRAGRRRNRALLLDRRGELIASFDKLHLPCEEGFWESDHYEPGETLAKRIDLEGLALGVQICSDLNRPQGSQILAAQGVEVILAPRATPQASYDRWLTVGRANALTCATYVISVNRPPEPGLPLSPGGHSFCVDPEGRVIAESSDPLTLVTLEPATVERARREYPGYLAVRAGLYARGWAELVEDTR